MDYKAILNLMKEMNHTDLTKLEIEEDGIRICMEKAANIITAVQQPVSQGVTAPQAIPANPVNILPVQTQPMPVLQTAPSWTVTNQAEAFLADASGKQAEEANMKKIVSPMVGTFYAAPSPDKPLFIKVGDKVKKGQTVCIIEAMKLLNEIESEMDGEIVKVLVDNEAMVEFGQPLFLVK